MSGIALVATPEAIVVASDGAIFDERASVIAISSKIIVSPEWSMFVTGRGGEGVYQRLQFEIRSGVVAGFDAFRERLPEAALMLHEADGGAGRDFTLVFGGWSAEAGCFRTYRISSGVRRIERPAGDEDAAQSATQSAAWQVDEIEGLWCAPWPGLKVASECGVDSLNGDVDRSISVAEKLIVAARRQRSPLVGATGEHYWVGGFLQLTVIKRDFAQSWISRRWPDRLGEPITPLPEEPEQRSGVERAPGRTRRRHLASLATRPTTVRYD